VPAEDDPAAAEREHVPAEYGLGAAEVGTAPADDPVAPEDGEAIAARAKACHEMLLRLAGTAPDDLLASSRGWLADGDLGSLARALTFWALSSEATLADSDADLLSQVLEANGMDASPLDSVSDDDFEPFVYYEFAAELPAEPGNGAAAETSATATKASRRAEQAAVKAVAKLPGVIGLWRAWRLPGDRAPWPPPKRIFLIEVGTDADEIAVTREVQERLTAAREADPQVEVYQTGYELPLYHELGRSYGALLWAAAEDPGIRLASVFDDVSPETGPSFRPDHPRLEQEEAAKVAAYMYSGAPLLVTMTRMDDIVDVSQAAVVPMDFRTDGTWIWSDASTYYLEEHQLEPDTGLLAHVRASDYEPPDVDGVAMYRALKVLQEPLDEEPVLTFDGAAGEPAADPDLAGQEAAPSQERKPIVSLLDFDPGPNTNPGHQG
jgi:hypothetical protein